MKNRIINPSCSDIYKLLINGGYMTNLDKDGDPFIINEHNRKVYILINSGTKTLVMTSFFYGDDSFEIEKECLYEDLTGNPTNPDLSQCGNHMLMCYTLSFVDHLNVREFYNALFYFNSKYMEILSEPDIQKYYPYSKKPDSSKRSESNALN